jgi:hypothetical protein
MSKNSIQWAKSCSIRTDKSDEAHSRFPKLRERAQKPSVDISYLMSPCRQKKVLFSNVRLVTAVPKIVIIYLRF